MITDLESAYKKVEAKHTDYLEGLDEDDENDEQAIATANTCLETLYEELCKARLLNRPSSIISQDVQIGKDSNNLEIFIMGKLS